LSEFTFTNIVIKLGGFNIVLGLDSLATIFLMRQLIDLGADSTLRLSRVLRNNEMVRMVVSVNINIIDGSRTEMSSIVLIMLSPSHSAVGVVNSFDIGFSSHFSLFTGV
jgi:hypothetical protein